MIIITHMGKKKSN